MPDKDSEEENIKDAYEVCKILKIDYKEINLTPFLEKLNVYQLIPDRFLKNRILIKIIFKFLKRKER